MLYEQPHDIYPTTFPRTEGANQQTRPLFRASDEARNKSSEQLEQSEQGFVTSLGAIIHCNTVFDGVDLHITFNLKGLQHLQGHSALPFDQCSDRERLPVRHGGFADVAVEVQVQSHGRTPRDVVDLAVRQDVGNRTLQRQFRNGEVCFAVKHTLHGNVSIVPLTLCKV